MTIRMTIKPQTCLLDASRCDPSCSRYKRNCKHAMPYHLPISAPAAPSSLRRLHGDAAPSPQRGRALFFNAMSECSKPKQGG